MLFMYDMLLMDFLSGNNLLDDMMHNLSDGTTFLKNNYKSNYLTYRFSK